MRRTSKKKEVSRERAYNDTEAKVAEKFTPENSLIVKIVEG